MNCPYCNTPLAAGDGFCPACGAKLERPAANAAAPSPVTPTAAKTPEKRLCAVCGRELKPGATFCGGCGAPAGAHPAPGQVSPPAYPQQPYPQRQINAQPQVPQRQSAPRQGQGAAPPAAPYPPRQQAPYGQRQVPPQQYRQPYPQPQYAQPYAPPRKKRSLAVPIIALVLVAALLFTGLVAPGFFLKKSRAEALINRVQVHLPNPTGPEAVVRLTGDIALQYYIQARLYLEKLSRYDAGAYDADEYFALVQSTLTALEDAEKISAFLSKAADLWMACDDVQGEATYEVIQTAKGQTSAGLFAMKAYAAEDSRSEVTAKDVINAFDKAKNGEKIKAVAELLGTDVKHAAVELKIALAKDEKDLNDKIAVQADTCVKVAKTLKTAGTVAGVVIAAAPIATGAAAAMATGEMLATGAGVVVSTVNAGLEVVSTGAMLYHGTDDNQVTQIADAISESKFMQTVNVVTSVAGLGYNVKNAFDQLEGMAKAGAGAKEIGNFLNTLSDGKTVSDVYGMLSFGLSNLDLLPGPGGAAASEGVKTLLTMVTHTGEDGLTIDIADTVIGTGKSQLEAVDRLLDGLGITDMETRGVLDQAVGLYRGEEPDGELPTDPEDPAPPELVDNLLSAYTYISPDKGMADLDRTIESAKSFLGELSMYQFVTESGADPKPGPASGPQLNPESDYLGDDEPTATPAPTPTPEPTAAPTPSPTPEVHGGYADGISGTYSLVIDDRIGIQRTEHIAEVTLDRSGGMEITFPVTSTMITNFDTGATVTQEGTASIKGTYDPKTHVFAGTGSTELTDLLINGADFVLTFDADASPVRAAGTMHSEGELWGSSYAYDFDVSMVRQR